MSEIKPIAWLVGNDSVGPYALRHTDPKGWKYGAGLMKISDHEAEVARLRAEVEKVRGYEVAPLEAKVAELRAEVEAYRKDAKRYLFIRNEKNHALTRWRRKSLDDLVDAAMGASA